MSRRRRSILTVTDQFCGAGGSSIGAIRAGLEVRQALNHWKLATETYATNNQQTDVDCTDVSACDPRRYPNTDILITSPECTTHSPAGGSRRRVQTDFFRETGLRAEDIRSRATAWDVVRFSEFHQYRIVITENVMEFTRWALFPEWINAMHKLDYLHRVVSLNSMHRHPTPQSRDRVYVVFWKKGNRAPNLDHTPPAFCSRCEKMVESRQTWKNGRAIGKYRQQYVFTCPGCRVEVAPYYYAALNALDFSIPAERIGDRSRPLRPRTMDRIKYGLDKYGRVALVIRTRMAHDRGYGPGDGGRVKTTADPLRTQVVGTSDALFSPPAFLVETMYSHSPDGRVRGVDAALMTQGTRQAAGLVTLPFLVGLSNGSGNSSYVRPVDEAAPTQTTAQDQAFVIPPAAMVPQRSNNTPKSLADPLPGVCTGNHHMMIQGAALLTMRAHPELLLRGLDQPLPVQVAQCTQDWVIQRQPFLVSYDRTNPPTGSSEPLRTLSTVDREALLGPTEELSVEDCFFRMLQPHEIKAAMAFPSDYQILGNKRDQVKQCGNAVTPPAEEWLIRRCVESLL